MLMASGYGQSYSYARPETRADGWETRSLQEMGLDTILIDTLFTQLFQQKHKIHSTLVIKEGKIVVEEYFNGNTRESRYDIRSATKSVISLLVGIALDKGFIASVDDPMNIYLKDKVPEKNKSADKENISIRHLLTMSSGLECNDWNKKSRGQEDKVFRKRDWIQYTLDLPMVDSPGKTTSYCSMGTVLAAEIVSKASGFPIDVFAEKYLFQPLGITNVNWGHTTTGKPIVPSAKRLYMTSRDMAKIGQLVAKGGIWNGKTVISKEWIAKATMSQTKLSNLEYGFLWWKIPFSMNGKKIHGTVATGNGGQYIMIFEDWDLVVVFTGGAYNSEQDKVPFAITNNIFLPVFAKNK